MSKLAIEPQQVDDVTLALPANVTGTLLPPEDEIPDEFTDNWTGGNKWCDLASEWFHSGLHGRFAPKDGVDEEKALRHLRAVIGSFEPSHEHKIAGVGYLMSLWFDDFKPTAPTAADTR